MDRYRRSGAPEATVAPGFDLSVLAGPSRLYGANGITFGPDGRLFVAQHYGSQVSAIDVASGSLDDILAKGGPVLAVDDLAFDDRGTLYLTETMRGRVAAVTAHGAVRVVAEGLPDVNGITAWQGRLFVDECRPAGRLLEIFSDGAPPRVLAEGRPAPNGLAVGPDGLLYWPEVISGEVWRLDPDGGPPERILGGLAAPVAVKFDGNGRLTILAAGSGEVLRVDLATATTQMLAKCRVGFDNLAFDHDGRLFVSWCVDGGIAEIRDGDEVPVVAPGFVWPLGLAVTGDDVLYAGDHLSLRAIGADGDLRGAGSFFETGFPGPVWGVAPAPAAAWPVGDGRAGGLIVTTSAGTVAWYDPVRRLTRPLAEGFAELLGVAAAPDGRAVVAEAGGGRLLAIGPEGATRELARGLRRPAGVAVASDGTAFVSEEAAGRVIRLSIAGSDGPVVVADGLARPQGVALAGADIAILDVDSKTLWLISPVTGERTALATDLPVGAPPGVAAQLLPGLEMLPGPLSPFADLATDRGGTVYIGADGAGAVLALRPT